MTHNDMSSFLEQLVEAKAALDREPQHQQRIKDLEETRDILHWEVDDMSNKLTTATETLEARNARIATLEAELAQSRFQASSAMEKLSAFKGLVGSTIFGLSSAVSEAEISSNEPSALSGQSEVGKSADGSATPISSPTVSGQSAPSTENASTEPREAETSSPQPVALTDVQSPPASSTAVDATSHASGQEAWQAKPHAGKSWWLKPAAMTWGEWVDGDGCEPNWAYSRELK